MFAKFQFFRGIDDGGNLPRELLVSLFDSIKTVSDSVLDRPILRHWVTSCYQEPFKIPEDDGNDLMHTFFNPDKEGWLWKQGGRYKFLYLKKSMFNKFKSSGTRVGRGDGSF